MQAGLDRFEREIMRHISCARDFGEADAVIGAGDGEISGIESDVALVGFQQMGGDGAALFDDLARRDSQRRAADCDAARAKSAGAVWHDIGVALDISIFSIGTPSCDERICAKLVSWPWP